MGGGNLDEYLSVLTLELGRLALGDLKTGIARDLELRPAAGVLQQPRMAIERSRKSMDQIAGVEFDALRHALSEHRNKSRTIR